MVQLPKVRVFFLGLGFFLLGVGFYLFCLDWALFGCLLVSYQHLVFFFFLWFL